MIIMLTGLKQSGKSTVANYLNIKYNYSILAFAKKIKEVSHIMFGWKEEDDERLKEKIDEFWGISRREFWQWLGTEAMQYSLPEKYPNFSRITGRGFWARVVENEILKDKNRDYVISDFRFPLEYEIIKPYNVTTIKVTNNRVASTDLHESERYIATMECDYVVENNGTKEELYAKIDQIMHLEEILQKGIQH